MKSRTSARYQGTMGERSLLCLMIGACTVVYASKVGADTIVVLKDGSGDAVTIAGGVAMASPGDSVLVGPGTYSEQVTIEVSLTLVGRDGAAATTIDGSGNPHCIHYPVDMGDLVISDLQLIHASGGYPTESGFAIHGTGNVKVKKCQIHENMGGVYWNGDVHLEGVEAWYMGLYHASPFIATGTLDVQECIFHDFYDTVLATYGSPLVLKNSVFHHAIGYPAVGINGPATIEGCVFHDMESAAIGPYSPIPRPREWGPGFDAPLVIRGNTFSGVDGGAVIPTNSGITIVEFSQNIVTGGREGVFSSPPAGSIETISCNNVWGNGTNWAGIPDPTGQNGNISVPPLYCDAEGRNFFLSSNSPCLAAGNSCGVLIGALGEGCGPTAVKNESWGQIKSRFR